MINEDINILVVDDNPDHRELICDSLENSDLSFHVECVDSGEAFFEKLNQNSIDLAVVDYRLPRMDGLEIIKRIRQKEMDLPVVLISAEGDDCLVRDALRHTATDYVSKSSSYFAKLPSIIHKLLSDYYSSKAEKKYFIKLKQIEKQYHATFNSLADPIFVINRYLDITFANKALLKKIRIFNRDPKLIGKNFLEVIPFLPKGMINGLEKVFKTKKIQALEEKISYNNIDRYFFIQKIPIIDNGGVDNIIVVLQDVSRQKEREKNLENQKNKAEKINNIKSILIANISHELRTPLIAISGFLDLMQDDPLSEKQQEILEIIRKNGNHLLSLSNDLLDLSRIEAGQVSLGYAPFSLSALLNDVKSNSEILVEKRKKKIKIKMVFPGNIKRFIKGDQIRLKQVLENLINNAIKFTYEGTIIFGLSILKGSNAKDKRLEFFVIDNGPGISKPEQKMIFDPFKESYQSLRSSYKGFGLGLSISKNLVELMNGEIRVESPPGNIGLNQDLTNTHSGTAFYFTIPYKIAKDL